MKITTADLFDLAKIMSDAYDASGIDNGDGDVVEWVDLLPAEQAAYAEGIRAVIYELERRGWKSPEDVESAVGDALALSMGVSGHQDQTIRDEAMQHVWFYWFDVPEGVRYTTADSLSDSSGLVWLNIDGVRYIECANGKLERCEAPLAEMGRPSKFVAV